MLQRPHSALSWMAQAWQVESGTHTWVCIGTIVSIWGLEADLAFHHYDISHRPTSPWLPPSWESGRPSSQQQILPRSDWVLMLCHPVQSQPGKAEGV